jgi:hypothetical protein
MKHEYLGEVYIVFLSSASHLYNLMSINIEILNLTKL